MEYCIEGPRVCEASQSRVLSWASPAHCLQRAMEKTKSKAVLDNNASYICVPGSFVHGI